jgi:ferredoxin-type protein NapG
LGRAARSMGDRAKKQQDVTRREFLGLAGLVGKAAAVVAVGGVINLSGRNEAFSFSRPPGAMPEDEFLSLCLRCDRCRIACPYGVVRPITVSESVVLAGTPMLSGYCRRCWKCDPVCPTGALVS